ncbi:MAG: CRISPR-associated endoribonuclease Cas6 [Lachnospiraceae bacterium]|nr:CRISPR-associated endoribonuclease Cas6 [Lachnospiraceae bacterium]
MTSSFRVYEISVKIFSLKDFKQEEACSISAGFVDACLAKNNDYLNFHQTNCYKLYTQDMPYPTEPDGIYKREKVYTIRIRTVNKELLDYLAKNLSNTSSDYLKGLTVNIRIIPRKYINKIYSITPVVMKLQNSGYWKSNITFDEYEKLLKNNLIKKYNYFFNVKLDEDFQFYTNIQKTNRKPIDVKYKNISLLGDKFDIEIADNETAQSLAYLALAVGLGGNNSRSCGFVNYKFI